MLLISKTNDTLHAITQHLIHHHAANSHALSPIQIGVILLGDNVIITGISLRFQSCPNQSCVFFYGLCMHMSGKIMVYATFSKKTNRNSSNIRISHTCFCILLQYKAHQESLFPIVSRQNQNQTPAEIKFSAI